MVLKERVKTHIEHLSHSIKSGFGGAGSRVRFIPPGRVLCYKRSAIVVDRGYPWYSLRR